MEKEQEDALGLPVKRITVDDIAALKAMFEDNAAGAKAVRKIFYPELTSDDPLQMNEDMMTKLLLDGMSTDQMVVEVRAHQKLVKHIEGCLSVIKHLVGEKTETAEQVLARLTKDSAK